MFSSTHCRRSGITADAASEWLRERWQAEQFLLQSGLDVTIIHPGMIVGTGGRGFEMMASQAKHPITVSLSGQQAMRSIAISDLVYYLISILDNPRTCGQCYDVGNDDVLTNDQMTDILADILGRLPPRRIQIPQALLKVLAPALERAGKLPAGAMRGILDSLEADGSGEPSPIRVLLPRALLSFRQAAQSALVTR